MEVQVAGYIRVSTDIQQISPEAQEDAIREVCKTKGWKLKEFYMDEDYSGSIAPEDRPEMKRLMSDAKSGTFNLLLVVNFDRLSRDNADSSYIRKELEFRGVNIAETSSPDMDSRSSTGKLIYSVKGAVAEFELDLIKERTRRAMKKIRARGHFIGKEPRGFHVVGFECGIPSHEGLTGELGKQVPDELGRKVLDYLKTSPKVPASILQVALGFESYKTAWNMRNECRKFMALETIKK